MFISQRRMREIRWEESVLRGRLAREGDAGATVTHSTCHCGSVGCVGVPIALAGAGCVFAYPSGPEGFIDVDRAGCIVKATLSVNHTPEGRFRVTLTAPSGRAFRVVSGPRDAEGGSLHGRQLELPQVRGEWGEGRWRVVVESPSAAPSGVAPKCWLYLSLRRGGRRG